MNSIPSVYEVSKLMDKYRFQTDKTNETYLKEIIALEKRFFNKVLSTICGVTYIGTGSSYGKRIYGIRMFPLNIMEGNMIKIISSSREYKDIEDLKLAISLITYTYPELQYKYGISDFIIDQSSRFDFRIIDISEANNYIEAKEIFFDKIQ